MTTPMTPEKPIHFVDLVADPMLIAKLKERGIEVPTPIQAKAIPPFLEGKNVVALAQTGSGKTLAFGLPIIEKVDPADPACQALILAPTRELAVQISQVFWDVRPDTLADVRVIPVYGGSPKDLQRDSMRQGRQVIVATPGRLIDFIWDGDISFDKIKIVILDEADRMLEMGFIDDIEFILSCFRHKVQFGLFSATMPPPIRKIIEKHVSDPQYIQLQQLAVDKPKINQTCYAVSSHDKFKTLLRVMQGKRDTTLIFCRSRIGVDRLASQLNQAGHRAAAIHGGKEQDHRDRILRGFKRGNPYILVATDLASRGLHIDDVARVINYDVPLEPEDYVHRIGRTGRAGKTGEAVTIATPSETKLVERIERLTGEHLLDSKSHGAKPRFEPHPKSPHR